MFDILCLFHLLSACCKASPICRHYLPFKWFATRMHLSLCSVCGHYSYCTSFVAVDVAVVFFSHCVYTYVILSESPASLLSLLSCQFPHNKGWIGRWRLTCLGGASEKAGSNSLARSYHSSLHQIYTVDSHERVTVYESSYLIRLSSACVCFNKIDVLGIRIKKLSTLNHIFVITTVNQS